MYLLIPYSKSWRKKVLVIFPGTKQMMPHTSLWSLPRGHWSVFPFKSLPAGLDLLRCLLLLLFLPVAHWRNTGVKSDLSDSSKATQCISGVMKVQRRGHWLVSVPVRCVVVLLLLTLWLAAVADFGPVHTHTHISKIPHAHNPLLAGSLSLSSS